MHKLHRILPCLFFLASSMPAASESTIPSNERRIALTIDDLPWVMNRNEPPVDLDKHYGRLITTLEQTKVPAIGFIHDGKLYQHETLRPERIDMLDKWLDAGLELGTRWIHRWAKAENRPDTFFHGAPQTARWVMKLAGVESSAE